MDSPVRVGRAEHLLPQSGSENVRPSRHRGCYRRGRCDSSGITDCPGRLRRRTGRLQRRQRLCSLGNVGRNCLLPRFPVFHSSTMLSYWRTSPRATPLCPQNGGVPMLEPTLGGDVGVDFSVGIGVDLQYGRWSELPIRLTVEGPLVHRTYTPSRPLFQGERDGGAERTPDMVGVLLRT